MTGKNRIMIYHGTKDHGQWLVEPAGLFRRGGGRSSGHAPSRSRRYSGTCSGTAARSGR
jgi:hypothetical protein